MELPVKKLLYADPPYILNMLWLQVKKKKICGHNIIY